MTARIEARAATLTIGDLYAQPPLMPLWPDFGRGVCQLAESTTYQLAAQGRLPVETVRLGRKLYVRTRDVLAFCGLPERTQNDDDARVAALTPPVENTTVPTGSNQLNENGAGVASPTPSGK